MVDERERCAAVREEFSALLDGELTVDERDRVESHLALCADCLRELDGLKKVDVLFRRLPSVDAPPEVEARIRSALRPTLLRLLRTYNRTLMPAMAAGVLLSVAGALTWSYGFNAEPAAEYAQMAALADESQAESTAVGDAPMPTAPGAEGTMGGDGGFGGGGTRTRSGSSRVVEEAERADNSAPMSRAEVAQRADADKAQSMEADEAKKELGLVPAAPESPEPVELRALRSASNDVAASSQTAASSMVAAVPPAAAKESEAALGDALAKSISAPRTFSERDGTWYESGYRDEAAIVLDRDSDRYRELVADDPHLRGALALHERAVFRVGSAWYRVN